MPKCYYKEEKKNIEIVDGTKMLKGDGEGYVHCAHVTHQTNNVALSVLQYITKIVL